MGAWFKEAEEEGVDSCCHPRPLLPEDPRNTHAASVLNALSIERGSETAIRKPETHRTRGGWTRVLSCVGGL